MRTTYPPYDKQYALDEPPLGGEKYMGDILPMLEEDTRVREDETAFRSDEPTDDVLSLLEENARLRGLITKLSNLVHKNVSDRR
jgi:hypothetical protein